MAIKYDEKSCGIVLFRRAHGASAQRAERLRSSEPKGEQKRERSEHLFLLLHYPGGHFDFPKGHVEKGEEEHQTALRELTEETGISQIEFIAGFREPISYIYRRGKKMSNKQVVFFLAQTKVPEVSISHEHTDFIWLPYEEALKKVTFDNAKNLLKMAKGFLEKDS